MKRPALFVVVVFVLALAASAASAYAQATFKIPYRFQVGGNKLLAGEYLIGQKDDQHIFVRQLTTGTEVLAEFSGRLPQPQPPVAEPQLVFLVVGNFEPSYTEYVTDYVLSELWLPGAEGYLVRSMKGTYQKQVVKGQAAKK